MIISRLRNGDHMRTISSIYSNIIIAIFAKCSCSGYSSFGQGFHRVNIKATRQARQVTLGLSLFYLIFDFEGAQNASDACGIKSRPTEPCFSRILDSGPGFSLHLRMLMILIARESWHE